LRFNLKRFACDNKNREFFIENRMVLRLKSVWDNLVDE